MVVDGDLSLSHRLEQRALGAGRGPVDFIGQQQVREYGAFPKIKGVIFLVKEIAEPIIIVSES